MRMSVLVYVVYYIVYNKCNIVYYILDIRSILYYRILCVTQHLAAAGMTHNKKMLIAQFHAGCEH